MEINDLKSTLKSAIDNYNIELVVLADVNGKLNDFVKEENKDEYISLYNSLFYDERTIKDLYENLKVSILPQMVSQGVKFCYLGLIGDDLIYGVFGKTNKTTKEQYFYSKEIDSFIQERYLGANSQLKGTS